MSHHGDPFGAMMGKGQPGFNQSHRSAINFLLGVIGGHWFTCAVFLRTLIGQQAANIRAAWGLMVLGLVAVLNKDSWLLGFLGVFFVVTAIRRLQTAILVARGCHVHSRFEGYTALAWRFGLSELWGKIFEQVLCLGLGIGLMCASQAYKVPCFGLGLWIALGCVSLGFESALIQATLSRKVRSMRDAQWEARQIMGRR